MNIEKLQLGGREYEVPELAFRQWRVVTPLTIKISKDFKERVIDKKRKVTKLDFTTENWNDMAEVVYQGITRGTPKFEREAFLDFSFKQDELIIAYNQVLKQNGTDFEAVESGEDQGLAAPLNPPTGNPT